MASPYIPQHILDVAQTNPEEYNRLASQYFQELASKLFAAAPSHTSSLIQALQSTLEQERNRYTHSLQALANAAVPLVPPSPSTSQQRPRAESEPDNHVLHAHSTLPPNPSGEAPMQGQRAAYINGARLPESPLSEMFVAQSLLPHSNVLVPPSPSRTILSKPIHISSEEEWQNFPQLLQSAGQRQNPKTGVFLFELNHTIVGSRWNGRGSYSITGKKGFEHFGYTKQANGSIQLETKVNRPGDFTPSEFKDNPSPLNPDSLVERSFADFIAHSTDYCISAGYAMDVDGHSQIEREGFGLAQSSPLHRIMHTSGLQFSAEELPGISLISLYICLGPHVPFALHSEDWDLHSINVHLAGAPKYWVVIWPDDYEKLEALSGPPPSDGKYCSQYVRHRYLWIPLETLDNASIRYTIVIQRPSQVVVTLPKAYHYGFNEGPNFNEAVNWAPYDYDAAQKDYTPCSRQCEGRVKERKYIVDLERMKRLTPGAKRANVSETEVSNKKKKSSDKSEIAAQPTRKSARTITKTLIPSVPQVNTTAAATRSHGKGAATTSKNVASVPEGAGVSSCQNAKSGVASALEVSQRVLRLEAFVAKENTKLKGRRRGDVPKFVDNPRFEPLAVLAQLQKREDLTAVEAEKVINLVTRTGSPDAFLALQSGITSYRNLIADPNHIIHRSVPTQTPRERWKYFNSLENANAYLRLISRHQLVLLFEEVRGDEQETFISYQPEKTAPKKKMGSAKNLAQRRIVTSAMENASVGEDQRDKFTALISYASRLSRLTTALSLPILAMIPLAKEGDFGLQITDSSFANLSEPVFSLYLALLRQHKKAFFRALDLKFDLWLKQLLDGDSNLDLPPIKLEQSTSQEIQACLDGSEDLLALLEPVE